VVVVFCNLVGVSWRDFFVSILEVMGGWGGGREMFGIILKRDRVISNSDVLRPSYPKTA
jgi:hypothetical protein